MNSRKFEKLLVKILDNKLERLVFNDGYLGMDQVWQLSQAILKNHSIIELELTSSLMPLYVFIFILKAFNESCTLKILKITNDKITLSYAKELYNFLLENKSLTTLDLSYCFLGDRAIRVISAAFYFNHSLLTVNLAYNAITLSGCEYLANALKNNNSIKNLDLSGNDLHGEGVKYLGEMLLVNNVIQTLNLRFNRLNADDLIVFKDVYLKRPVFVAIDLGHNYLGDRGAVELANYLERYEEVLSFYFPSNAITARGLMRLIKVIAGQSELRTFGCYENNIGDEGGLALAELITASPKLELLNAYCCNIGVEGGLAIAKALQSKFTLTSLNLGGTDFNSYSAFMLACWLEKDVTLRYLNLSDCCLNLEEAGLFIIYALQHHPVIQTINISENRLGKLAAYAVADVLRSNASLTEINLARNLFNDLDSSVIFKALRHNSKLIVMRFDRNEIKVKAAIAFTDTILVNMALQHVYLQECSIGDAELALIWDGLRTNYSLLTLNVEGNQITLEFSRTIYKLLSLQLDANRKIAKYLSDYRTDMFVLSQYLMRLIKSKNDEYSYSIEIRGKEHLFARCLQQAFYHKGIPSQKVESLVNSSIYKNSEFKPFYEAVKDLFFKRYNSGRPLYKLRFFSLNEPLLGEGEEENVLPPKEIKLTLALNL